MVTASLGMTFVSFWAYLASLPVEASDLVAPDFVSVEDLFSDAGADEEELPFPLPEDAPDFLA
jgi:hypothetical protein